ncbi:MAG: hypothetical protein MZU97_04060 [Bacillus subtilis]|nr:hypothetical protein [Bacillus subtilis]
MLHQLSQIEKKYGKSIAELMEHQAKLTKMLDHVDDFDVVIQESRRALSQSHQQLLRAASDLTAVRKQIAKRIETELHTVFGELVLNNTKFEIRIESLANKDETNDAGFTEYGVDSIDFFISTNPGEPLKPLSKTVSGGEMSRVMLAFKTIFIASQQLTTMIFDEIDTGISGFVAKQIAKKIKSIAASCQVVSITHLPQVVGIAEHHLKVTKAEVKGRTIAAGQIAWLRRTNRRNRRNDRRRR